MGVRNLLILKTHFGSINMCLANGFVCGNMIGAVGSLWVFFCDYVLLSFGLILKFIFRFHVGERKNDQSERNFQDSENDVFKEQVINFLFHSGDDIYEENGKREGEEEETEAPVFMETNSDFHEECTTNKEGETEISASTNNVNEDSDKGGREADHSLMIETVSTTTTSKYEAVSGKDVSVFMEEPTIMTFTFREIFSNSKFSAISDIVDKEKSEFNSQVEPVHEEEENCSVNRETDSEVPNDSSISDEVSDSGSTVIEELPELNSEKEHFVQEENCSVNREGSLETDEVPNGSAISNKATDSEASVEEEFPELNSEKGSVDEEEITDSDLKQITFAGHYNSNESDSKSEDFGRNDSSEEDDLVLEDVSSLSDSDSDTDTVSSSSSGLVWGNSDRIDDLIAYDFLAYKNGLEGFGPENLKEKGAEDEYIEIEPHMKDLKYNFPRKAGNKDEKEEKLDKLEYEEFEDGLDWDQDDTVEQLKMELKNARQGGLPTILEEEEDEETESPKLVEDLKPLKIEEKMEFIDQIYKIQRVYKSYAEKMRKLDILNYQTMHALGLLQLKDPLRLISAAKPLILQNLWPCKVGKIKSDPLLKSVQELHRDLELVYVGQVCLSWEILCWQHKKAQELKEYDSPGFHQYNLIAGEFQLFHVLIQRFIENEPFQGPRVQNYVKNRCVIRDLLQVPAIKDDCMNDKNTVKGEEEDPIASGKLAEIIKQSMQVFADFVRADKDDGNVILRVSQQTRTNFDPTVSDLRRRIRTHQQKKEKKLKDIVRSGNCIVRKFQKHHEDQLDHEQLLAQVELKLISRVLNMSKLRKDHLIWCNEKLNRIKFINKKIMA